MLKLWHEPTRGAKMVNVFDVAKYILQKQGSMTTMKLQKLVYYSQVWSIVWDGEKLFNQKIEAWACGPVVRELYNVHKGQFKISALARGNVNNLNAIQRETIDKVLDGYGDKSAQWLIELTHCEKPWKDARQGIPLGENCENEIAPSSLEEYYGSL
jgi:uncharacterized phage-associated protein